MRLIDADEIPYTDLSEGHGVCWVTFMDWIKKMPTVNVRENISGEWIEKPEIGDCCYICSECGFVRDAYFLDVGNYCPNCGAQMKEE